jgi:hypothetical protein
MTLKLHPALRVHYARMGTTSGTLFLLGHALDLSLREPPGVVPLLSQCLRI